MAAEAAGSGAWSHGIGLVLIRSLPYTLACTAKSASGMAGGFVGRQPVTSFADFWLELYQARKLKGEPLPELPEVTEIFRNH